MIGTEHKHKLVPSAAIILHLRKILLLRNPAKYKMNSDFSKMFTTT